MSGLILVLISPVTRRESLTMMTSPSTGAPAVLAGIPGSLRDELLSAFNEIERNFRERRWEPSELKAANYVKLYIRSSGDW